MMELVVLLLPVAAVSGWIAAKRSYGKGKQRNANHNVEYFKGLNFLLNEQPDKAIDVFIQMLDVDSDTVETHLALGNLFRRRGEVDRAIRIHQNLIARPTLQPEHRAHALLELGQDYLRAGLYDRAESLFQELTESELHREQALENLLFIYEKEKEWSRSLQIAGKLEAITGKQMNNQRAHYYCEMADEAYKSGALTLTLDFLKKAQGCNRDSIRAAILLGEVEQAKGNHKAAIRVFKNVSENNPVYLPLILPLMQSCYEAIDNRVAFMDFLYNFVKTNPGPTGVMALSQVIRDEEGDAAAAQFLKKQLKNTPSLGGLYQLLSLESESEAPTITEIKHFLNALLDKMHEDNSGYKCTSCGFGAKTMHWLCPSCNNWSSIHPIQTEV
jgi:lipopolysaccharide biosynthesis regulator YciM